MNHIYYKETEVTPSLLSFRLARILDNGIPEETAESAGADSILHDSSAVADLWNAVESHIYGTRQELTDFDIMASSDGTQLKDLYSIIVGIGNEWQNLSASEQGSLLDALAGSQGDTLGSVLNNVSAIENAYQSAENASSSALQAQEERRTTRQGKCRSHRLPGGRRYLSDTHEGIVRPLPLSVAVKKFTTAMRRVKNSGHLCPVI